MNNHFYAILLSVVAGYLYYDMMESSIPTESNCSFSASPMTDLLAFVWGFIIMGYGIKKYDNPILTFLGCAVVVEHIFQLKRKI
jgi:hypothetical protein|uniref:Vitamin K epoxide reductase domain-containing protein n=1 Tax=viral metagenome TaxID=1070528 RepID=A0A6C0JD43_9ZZZZ|tara:strand:+ start:862 stop:1113 length:252 start_codon:yes stop_codon:yes gene_type:complete